MQRTCLLSKNDRYINCKICQCVFYVKVKYLNVTITIHYDIEQVFSYQIFPFYFVIISYVPIQVWNVTSFCCILLYKSQPHCDSIILRKQIISEYALVATCSVLRRNCNFMVKLIHSFAPYAHDSQTTIKMWLSFFHPDQFQPRVIIMFLL